MGISLFRMWWRCYWPWIAASRRSSLVECPSGPFKDVAVTVPAWFDDVQWMAIYEASSVIGLYYLGEVNSNMAVAIIF